jgi:hypothetical protein
LTFLVSVRVNANVSQIKAKIQVMVLSGKAKKWFWAGGGEIDRFVSSENF